VALRVGPRWGVFEATLGRCCVIGAAPFDLRGRDEPGELGAGKEAAAQPSGTGCWPAGAAAAAEQRPPQRLAHFLALVWRPLAAPHFALSGRSCKTPAQSTLAGTQWRLFLRGARPRGQIM